MFLHNSTGLVPKLAAILSQKTTSFSIVEMFKRMVPKH